MGEFRLLMVSAMYENGGNVTHRLLDGHPELFVYPFESQLGTRLVQDHLTSLYPVKYGWPVFSADSTAERDFKSIIDEECKVRARTPYVSKFRDMPFEFSDDERLKLFAERLEGGRRTRPAMVEAFFGATFDAWKDYARTGREQVYVGYSPIIAVDAGLILSELPEAHVLHVVRNPFSAYADTRKRPVPLSIQHYMTGWVTVQQHALVYRELFPDRLTILRYEDVIADPVKTLSEVCRKIGVPEDASLGRPSWNGEPLSEVYPWGTIRRANPEVNAATARELKAEERELIRTWTKSLLPTFAYEDMV